MCPDNECLYILSLSEIIYGDNALFFKLSNDLRIMDNRTEGIDALAFFFCYLKSDVNSPLDAKTKTCALSSNYFHNIECELKLGLLFFLSMSLSHTF